MKAKFFTELQDAVSKVLGGDVLVLLGDFNARVGRLEVSDDVWQGVIGKHGLAERNLCLVRSSWSFVRVTS